VLIAIVMFVENVLFPRHPHLPWHLNGTPVALAWFILAIVGVAANHLSEIGLPGGGKIAFRRLIKVEKAIAKKTESVASLSTVIQEYADQLQSWTNSVNILTENLDRYGGTENDRVTIVVRYCLERMEEAKDLIEERGDTIRLSFWLYTEEEGGLKLLLSDDIRDTATLDHVFRPGQGLAGQCYVENRTYNLPDGPKSIYYQRVAEPRYHGLLLVPVQFGATGEILGVLSVDRKKIERFDENAVNVARALGDLIAYAYRHPKAVGDFPDSPQ
jgi:hypothetical protein